MTKYLVYSSETKLSMLAPQIPKTRLERLLSKFRPELGFEKLGFKAKVSMDAIGSSDGLERIEKVLHELQSEDKIGTTEDPKAWFSGNMRMKWGAFSDYAAGLVMFTGTSNTTIVCLIGSI